MTSFLTSTMLLKWEITYLLIGLLCLIIAIVNLFMLVVHPEEKNLHIDELDE